MEDSTGAVSSVTLDNREFTQAHRYVLFNSENIYQFREDVFDAGIGPHCDEDDTYGFYEKILYSVTSNDAGGENLRWGRVDVEGMTIDASIIGERDLHEMDNLDDCEFINDESSDEDDNEVEYNDDE
nr:hypothetical protein CFP56_60158 [Quercus suber]